MVLSASTVIFFILSCGLWVAEARQYNAILRVQNGGRWGRWGPAQFCARGHAIGFRIRVDPHRMDYDLTGLNAISLLCDDGGVITSLSGPWGIWKEVQFCHQGRLVAFALRVQGEKTGDNTAANNIVFICSDDGVLIYRGIYSTGRFGQLSHRCTKGSICGIQTKVQSPQYRADNTALNDVKMFCCD